MKAFVLIIIFSIVSVHIFAQEPPKLVVNALKNKFPSAVEIYWGARQYTKYYEYPTKNLALYKTKYIYYWKADFKLNNKKASSTFTSDGNWICGETEKSINDLREEVRNAVKLDYPGCEIVSVNLSEWIGTGSWYYVKVKCGNIIKENAYNENGWHPPKI
jgi:hypothetical protein